MPLPSELGGYRDLFKRFERAEARRNGSWWAHMEEAYSYAAPQRETFFEYDKGQKKNTTIYDDTAIVGTQIFASRMQQTVVPPWQQFNKLVPGVDLEQEDDAQGNKLSKGLEEITDIVFNYIHRSNFQAKIYESFIDFAISTGVLTCEFDPEADELVFDAIPLPQVFLENGPRGDIATIWRKSEIEVRLVPQYWPDADISEKMKTRIEKKPDDKQTFIEGFVFNPKDGQTYYIVLSKMDKAIIYYQMDEVSPAIAFRGMVVPGENYGRGPVMQVLPTIKTLNLVKEFELTSGAIAASGAWTGVDDGAFNPYTVQIAPGIVIPVMSNENANPTLRALDMNFDFTFTQIKSDELKESINRVLFANPIGDIKDPTKTATEITIRRQMDLQEQSAFFSRVQTELVEKLMRRVVYVLQREGKIPPLTLDGKEVKIKHVSPIAKAMDLEDVQTLGQAVQMSQGMAGPEVTMLGFKVEDIPDFIAEKLGVDPSLQRSDGEKKQIQETVAQMIAAAQMEQQGVESA